MNPQIFGQLGVEGGQEELPALEENGRSFVLAQDLHRAAGVVDDSWGADEDTVERLAENLGLEIERRGEAVDLSAVGVAFELDRRQLEPGWGTFSFAQDDGTGTGPEHGESREARLP